MRLWTIPSLVGAAFALTGCPSFPGGECYHGACVAVDASGDLGGETGRRGDGGGEAGKRHDGGQHDAAPHDGKSPVDSTTHDGGHEEAGRPEASRDGGVDATHDGHVVDAGNDVKDVAVDSFVCSATGVPATEPCVIAEAYGVFVAPTGSDTTGAGTRQSPYATIGKSVTEAISAGKRVYVCGTSYNEQVTLTQAVEIYGGLECPTANDGGDAGTAWAYTGTLATVAPTAAGFALDVESASGAHFEDMAFVAQGAPSVGDAGADAGDAGSVAPGTSSIAVMVNSSMDVSFTRVSATAGNGAPGASAGPTPTNWCSPTADGGAPSADSGLNAPSGLVAPTDGSGNGGPSVKCACALLGSSKGGGGGESGQPGQLGAPGSANPATGNGTQGAGGSATLGACTAGNAGGDGTAGASGMAGSQGTLSSTGWSVSTATAGQPGDPGQGGGGGGGGAILGGAGGGAGGCGGSGGAPGSGGGASIAVAIIGGSVTMARVTLTTGYGGTGGSGGAGEPGQAGGAGGTHVPECSGGNGGDGAGGSGGGGGVGGPSVGVAATSSGEVTVDGTTLTNAATFVGPSLFRGGVAGGLGAGGTAGPAAPGDINGGNAGAPGSAGASGAVVQF
jgi:hypothetical protein